MRKGTVEVESGNNKKLGGEKKKKMKTKNKLIALVEIAVVLCSVLLVALPAIAAQEQNQEMQKVNADVVTTASEDDYVLGIYGNGNEDDTIDMGDVVYTKLAIFGKKPKTELCDAKYDGRINVLDVIQTNLIILGKEKELTVVDTSRTHVRVKKPLKRIVVIHSSNLETLRAIKVPKDIIVGTGSAYSINPIFFPEFNEVPEVSSKDIESVLNLNPDATIYMSYYGVDPAKTRSAYEAAGVALLVFDSNRLTNYTQIVRTLGYIFDKEDEAEEYLDWRGNIINTIKEGVEKIPEEDKPKVYFEGGLPYRTYSVYAYIEFTGGKNIIPDAYGEIDPEAVIDRKPDIIVARGPGGAWKGKKYGYYLDVGDTKHLEEIRDEILGRPELQKVPAVKNGKVYVISTDVLSFAPGCGSRHFLQLVYQAKWFHPELFEELDPKAIHQEYLTRFQGLDVDLDAKGVFVYHPEEHPDGN